MKIFHVGSHQFRESFWELLRELWCFEIWCSHLLTNMARVVTQKLFTEALFRFKSVVDATSKSSKSLYKANFFVCVSQEGHTSGSNIPKKILWWNSICKNLKDHYKRECSGEVSRKTRGRKPKKKPKQLFRIIPGMGGVNLLICCLSPGERWRHINKIPRKSQENAGTVPG